MLGALLDRVIGRGNASDRWLEAEAPRTRVHQPSVVPCVPDLLRQLRELRDDLDYYVEPDGWVLLLAWDPTKPRVHEARHLLTLGIDTLDTRLMVDGFSILDQLPPHAVWSGLLVRRARQIMQATPKLVDAHHEVRLRESDGRAADERGEAHLRDALQGDARSDHRFFFRGKRSVSGRSHSR